MQSDWILVVDQGNVKEEGSPRELGRSQESVFFKMIMQTGNDESKHLMSKINE